MGQRARRRQRERAPHRAPAREARARRDRGRERVALRRDGPPRHVVDERHEIDIGERAQLAKQMIRADAITAVGRVGQAMRENRILTSVESESTLAGTPAATTLSGMAEVTTAPAPITEFTPIRPSRRPRCRSSARADADHRALALLIPDRPGRVVRAMRVAAAGDVDARADEHVALDVHEPEEATRADLDVLVEASAGPRKMVPKLTTAVGAHCAMRRERNARRRYCPGSPGINESACVDPSRARSRPRIRRADEE